MHLFMRILVVGVNLVELSELRWNDMEGKRASCAFTAICGVLEVASQLPQAPFVSLPTSTAQLLSTIFNLTAFCYSTSYSKRWMFIPVTGDLFDHHYFVSDGLFSPPCLLSKRRPVYHHHKKPLHATSRFCLVSLILDLPWALLVLGSVFLSQSHSA